MITANELSGVLAMMPAFATPDAIEISATDTIAVNNLKEGVDRIVRDGINNIATTGTYGECYNLLWQEFRTLAAATVTNQVINDVNRFLHLTAFQDIQ